jgi:Flp pilus assembly pilin Flp
MRCAQPIRSGFDVGLSDGSRMMNDETKEHALEYGLILGVGALLLILVFVNIHARIFG